MSNRDDKHWTERSAGSYQFMVAFDFVNQLDEQLAERGLRRSDLANKLGVTQGRVSQIFNNPRGLNLQTIIRLARATGLKVSVVTYDDHDPDNTRGPIESRVFRLCWERAGRPREAWDLLEANREPQTSVAHEPTVWSQDVGHEVFSLRIPGLKLEEAQEGPIRWGGDLLLFPTQEPAAREGEDHFALAS